MQWIKTARGKVSHFGELKGSTVCGDWLTSPLPNKKTRHCKKCKKFIEASIKKFEDTIEFLEEALKEEE